MRTPLNVVIDLSHHNKSPDFQKAKAAGIVGVIHKASEGLTYVDPTYAGNRRKALAAGLLWGAYHFGSGGNPAGQADHFLDVVAPGPADLLVLDFEESFSGPTMTLQEARQFIVRIQARVGRSPGLYSGSHIKQLLGSRHDPILVQCFLWLAQYGDTPVVPANWPTWTLWQYTDGSMGPLPHTVAGIGHCDRSKFNGTLSNLKRLWGVVE
jgi:lysozyme